MRTVKITYTDRPDTRSTIQIETEVLVDEETDPEQAGAEATEFLLQFQAGVIRAAGEAA